MRALGVLTGLIMILLAMPVRAADSDGPVNCKAGKPEPYITICNDPGLLDEDRQVAMEYRKVRDGIGDRHGGKVNQETSLFVAQQMAWNYDDYVLCKPSNAAAAYKDGVHGCAKAMMDKRLAHFHAMEADPSILMSAGAEYGHIEPWYLRIFAKQYEGRIISVGGWPSIANCRHPGNDLQIGGDAFTIKVEFEKIEPRELAFICRQAPDAWWRGVVKLDGQGKPYVHVTDFSDVKFPWDKGAAGHK